MAATAPAFVSLASPSYEPEVGRSARLAEARSAPSSSAAASGAQTSGLGLAMTALGSLLLLPSRRKHQAARFRSAPSCVALRATAEAKVGTGKLDPKEFVAKFDFDRVDEYELQDLEEIYINSLIYFYSTPPKELLSGDQYDKLVGRLDREKSIIRKLRKDEVRFIEASIAYYRGEPVLSDEEYSQLRDQVAKSGRRKDMTSFLMNQRSKQYLSDAQMKKFEESFYSAREFDFKKLDAYSIGELEELYIDALWCYHREKRALLSDAKFDQLKKTLYSKGSRFPTLKRFEVAFVEASIAKFRGEPVVSEEEFESLKAQVEASGTRKDVTAFLLYERGEQFLDAEQFESMKDEYEKLGISAVNLEQCTVAQMEEMYVDALWAYYRDGVQLLSDDQFQKLKEELQWQGSGFPTLRRYEIDFVKAALAYHKGEAVVSDEEWKELKAKVTAEGRRTDVTAFLLYSKGQEVLDADTFATMQKEMAKLGVNVQKGGSKALEQTLSITSDVLENDLLQVLGMLAALASVPTLLAIVVVWAIGLFLDLEFVPSADWGSVLSFEFVPLFVIGLAIGATWTNWILVFLDLQNPEILCGTCPSCSSDIKLFSGGAAPVKDVNYVCPECGCKMVLDTKARRISLAGSAAEVTQSDPDEFDWRKAWEDVKSTAKLGAKRLSKRLAS